MSTRCLIGKENKDKTITYIYCHHDGYVSWVGKTLVNYYKDEETIDKLLDLGDISCLGTTPVDIDTVSEEDRIKDAYCDTFMSRGEDTPAMTVKDEEAYLRKDYWQDYVYLFRGNKWYYKEVDHKNTTDWQPVEEQVSGL